MTEADAKRLARARKVAAQFQSQQDEWQEQYEDSLYNSALEARFKDATPPDILDMYERGVNEKGQPLDQFEFEALCEAWCGAIGDIPPSLPRDHEPAPKDVPGDPNEIADTPDDKMVSPADVSRMTGWSLSTLKRKRAAGLLPKPYQVSERRIGWRMRDIRALLEQMQEDRGRRH